MQQQSAFVHLIADLIIHYVSTYWYYGLIAVLLFGIYLKLNPKSHEPVCKVDFLDTPGGHILVLLIMFYSLPFFGYTQYSEALLGAILVRLMGSKTIQQLRNGKDK